MSAFSDSCVEPGSDEGCGPKGTLEHGAVSIMDFVAAVGRSGRDDAGHHRDPGGILLCFFLNLFLFYFFFLLTFSGWPHGTRKSLSVLKLIYILL